MRALVVGGTGLIGARLVRKLNDKGVDARGVSRRTGVNAYTADGLEDALDGVDVIVDVSSSPYADHAGALDFFETTTLNLQTYGAAADVKHHVVLSLVGTENLAHGKENYFLAKRQQEELLESGRLPYSIVRATQFFEFLARLGGSVPGGSVTLAEALMQPVAADDVTTTLAATVVGAPTMRRDDFAGPEVLELGDVVRRSLAARNSTRSVVQDPGVQFLGADIDRDSLLPGADTTILPTRFDAWLQQASSPVSSN
jgi:uncharacterized protein YbjT (DUF2867 family)